MKRERRGFGLEIGLAGAFLLAAAIALAQLGGVFDLSWWTLGGGGVSRGGPYELTGVIGQSDAGVLTGGPYALEGGFLSGAPGPARAGVKEWRVYSGN